MKCKLIVLSTLLLPVMSFAADTQRHELLGSSSRAGGLIIEDVRLDCKARIELYPEYEVEILSSVKGKREVYKLAMTHGKKYPEHEISVSRNGQEVCRYSTEQNIGIFTGKLSYTIVDKVSPINKFCEGRLDKDFSIFPHSSVAVEYKANFGLLHDYCSARRRKGADEAREYLSLPFGKAGPVPKGMIFTGIGAYLP